MAKTLVNFGYFSDTVLKPVYNPIGQTWDSEGGRLFILQELPSAELLRWLDSNATSVIFESQNLSTEPETWILDSNPYVPRGVIFVTDFSSNGVNYNKLQFVMNAGRNDRAIYYGSTRVARGDSGFTTASFYDTSNCTIKFAHAPIGVLLTWLQANGTKQ